MTLINFWMIFIFKRVAIEFASGIEDNPLVVSWLVEPAHTTTTAADEVNSTVIRFIYFLLRPSF